MFQDFQLHWGVGVQLMLTMIDPKESRVRNSDMFKIKQINFFYNKVNI